MKSLFPVLILASQVKRFKIIVNSILTVLALAKFTYIYIYIFALAVVMAIIFSDYNIYFGMEALSRVYGFSRVFCDSFCQSIMRKNSQQQHLDFLSLLVIEIFFWAYHWSVILNAPFITPCQVQLHLIFNPVPHQERSIWWLGIKVSTFPLHFSNRGVLERVSLRLLLPGVHC